MIFFVFYIKKIILYKGLSWRIQPNTTLCSQEFLHALRLRTPLSFLWSKCRYSGVPMTNDQVAYWI